MRNELFKTDLWLIWRGGRWPDQPPAYPRARSEHPRRPAIARRGFELRSVRLLLIIPLACAMLAACSDPPPARPEVTFEVDGNKVSTRPFQYCDVMVTECDRENGAQAKMK